MITTYSLRNLTLDDDAQGCRFDATPSQFGLLGSGTPELVTDFLLNMRIEATPSTWSITSFRAYYYSQWPDSPNWREAFARAFEVRVRFTKPFGGPRPEAFQQWSSAAVDPTWDAWKLPLEWAKGRVLIVCDCFQRTREQLLASLAEHPALEQACKQVELRALRPHVLQMRFDLGELTLPDDQPRIYSWMEEASYFCRTFTWHESVTIG